LLAEEEKVQPGRGATVALATALATAAVLGRGRWRRHHLREQQQVTTVPCADPTPARPTASVTFPAPTARAARPSGHIAFRAARGDEAGLLGELALRSKGHWGYDQAFLDACRAELTFSSQDVATRRIVVAESATGVLGFYSIDGQPPSGQLGNLWVVPEAIGTGLGRRLWQDAVTTAGQAGFASLRIEADPNALGFYQAMGAKQIGEAPSGSIPDRTVPVLLFELSGIR
jgi:ribosomal protein S18 acetylase RimI-like enzyme